MGDTRETGQVKKWNEKGFGFIERNDGGSVFCHLSQVAGRIPLIAGSTVSFVYEHDEKGGKATQVVVEEAAMEGGSMREVGTVKRWNVDKGFGFIGRSSGGDDAFVHKKDCGGKDLTVGQHVSFVYEQGPKGASAKNVKEEGEPAAALEEDEGARELGKVKSYNEEKGFAFIGRCVGGDDLFGHKKEFGDIQPYAGQPVSFIVATTEKGGSAKKIREEDSVPDLPISDEGRDFGRIMNFDGEKGFGFIVRDAGGDNARFFEKQCSGMTPATGMCVSFILEETEKGPAAKDVREEDPSRVARVTAKVHYGRVKSYHDPTDKSPTNGYGFIVPFDPPKYGAPQKYFFHMSEIETPDEYGGIEPDTNVSFIVVPARKGTQAAAVKIAEPPQNKKDEDEEPVLADSLADMAVKDDDVAASNDGWGDTGSW